MDRTRHSFATTGSNDRGGGGAGGGGSRNGGMDAVRRAFSKAHWGVDETSFYGGGGNSRSQQSSRAGSLSSSKHGDLTTSMVSNGKHELAWGGGYASDPRAEKRAAATAHLFGRQVRSRGEGHGGSAAKGRWQEASASGGFSAAGAAMAAEAVTPSVGRGSAYGFNGGYGGARSGYGLHSDGGPEHEGGGGKRNRWPGKMRYHGELGVPAPAPLPSTPPEMGKPKWRRSRRGNQEEWVRHEEKEKMSDMNQV